MSIDRGESRRARGREFVAQRVILPVQQFVHTEVSGSIVLLVAAVIAFAWTNSPWDQHYFDLWDRELSFDTSLFHIEETLGHFVNDGLMAIFFFVVGLEIKRELLRGELASPRKAALPIAGAIGGMAAPALIYAAFNLGGDGIDGWGIPMATDIAFALGVLSLLGSRIPFGLKVFLLALAIVDDLGAILVIAFFYTESVSFEALGWAAVALAAVLVAQRAGVRSVPVYMVLGFLFWVAVLESGIHATLAGVVLAMVTPAKAMYHPDRFEAAATDLLARYRETLGHEGIEGEQAVLSQFETLSRESEAPLDRLERSLHPWVSFGIIPLFALANAGLAVDGEFVRDALGSAVSGGVFFGLLIGKTFGITLGAWIAVRLGVAALPGGVSWSQVAGVGLLGGIGFTVSLFIAGLAFDNPALESQAKAGILSASILAGLGGFLVLRLLSPAQAPVIIESREP